MNYLDCATQPWVLLEYQRLFISVTKSVIKILAGKVQEWYSFAVIIAGPIGLVNLMTAKACGASKVAITGEYYC